MTTGEYVVFSGALTNRGGVAAYVRELMGELEKRGIAVRHVRSGWRQGEGRRRLGEVRARWSEVVEVLDRLSTRSREDWIWHLNPSLDWRSLVRDLAVLWALRRRGCRGVRLVQVHGWRHEAMRWVSVRRLLAKWMEREASVVAVLGESFKREWLARVGGRGRVEVIPVGVRLPEVALGKKGASGGLRFVFLGRVERDKGILDLLYAWAKARGDGVPATLLVAGSGGAMREAAALVDDLDLQETVRLLGYVAGERKQRVLEEGDVFVLPSRKEGLPVALVEAMAAGMAVIATDVGVIREVAEGYGWILPVGDQRALTRAVVEAKENPARVRTLGDRAVQVAHRFDITNIVDDLLRVAKHARD